jgi:hypothetical protein
MTRTESSRDSRNMRRNKTSASAESFVPFIRTPVYECVSMWGSLWCCGDVCCGKRHILAWTHHNVSLNTQGGRTEQFNDACTSRNKSTVGVPGLT